jgi:hypothetical protein
VLAFSPANTKLRKLAKKRYIKRWLKDGRKVYSLDLLSGWACPFASACRSKAIQTDEGLRIKDGPHCEFRCYSASQEAQYPNVYRQRKKNWQTIKRAKTKDKIVKLILGSLPGNIGVLRWHVAGDFFSQAYFDAALEVARRRPDILFYAYTKAIGWWFNRLDTIPNNFVLTASYGGVFDNLIGDMKLRHVKVVYSKEEAKKLGLPLDWDDSHAAHSARKNKSFALLIHGTQPATRTKG